MKLKAGAKQEYKKRHDAVWPEIKALVKANGIHQYHIFYDEETHLLFAVQQMDKTSGHDLSSEAIMRKWWDYMADIMEVNPDNSPVVVYLEPVFQLE